jgi:hypothetical protein
MEFIFNCPHCHRQLAAADNAHGQAVVCPACKQALVIPAPATVQPAAMPAPHHDDIVEELEEFKPPQPVASPAPRKETASSPLLPPVKPRQFSSTELAALPPMTRSQFEQEQRHRDRPIQRRAQLLVVGATLVVCVLVAAIIILITQLPGGYPPPTTPAKTLVATGPAQSLDLGRLTSAEQLELAQLAKRAFDNLPPDEDREINSIYVRINKNQPVTQEQIARFNSLFQKGASLLTVEQRQRLTSLFAKIVRRPAS